MDPGEVIRQAEKEFQEEQFRAAVEAHKTKLREKRTLWDRIFPWQLIIVRKDDVRRKRG